MATFSPSRRVGNTLVPGPGVGVVGQVRQLGVSQQGSLYYARKRRKTRAAVFTILAHQTVLLGFTMSKIIITKS